VDYPLEGDPSGRVLLWFEPEPPHRLRRVLVYRVDEEWPRADYQVTLNLIPETETRRVEDVPDHRPLYIRDVARVWGPPDWRSGSGLELWDYGLADGKTATLHMASQLPGVVESLRIRDADGKNERELIDPERYTRAIARDRKEARLAAPPLGPK